METYLVIERRGKQNEERAIRVVQWQPDGPLRTMIGSWSVDPRREVKKVHGMARRRDRIHSFVTGLCCAGHVVYMDMQFDDDKSHHGIHRVQSTQPVKNLPCWFVGFAWGLNRWYPLMHALNTYFRPHQRATVLDMTAQYYWGRPCERPLYLRVPASW